MNLGFPNFGRGRRVKLGFAASLLLCGAVFAVFTVTGRDSLGGGDRGTMRVYFIAAEERPWDYAPRRRNELSGRPFGEDEKVFVERRQGRIGSTYVKSLYRGYTDASFSRPAPRAAEERANGMLGPTIRAEVGDKIKVVFRNRTRIPQSVHAHGVFYDKHSEGTPYADGTRGRDKADDVVAPGRSHTYVWEVPERAGPGRGDLSSVLWMYHGHVDEAADTNAGLIGSMIVTRKGMAQPDGRPKDVDRELVTFFSVLDENASHYLARNTRRYARLRRPPSDDEEFTESNLMHSINGYVYGNGPLFEVRRRERVRWHTFSMGTEVDLHTPHWHGNVVTTGMGMRSDVTALLPGQMMSADMQPDAAGVWLFHCHVNDHITAGMQARYAVR